MTLAAPTEQLEAELSRLFAMDAAQLPVRKDLPRLAKRCQVTHHEHAVPVVARADQQQRSVPSAVVAVCCALVEHAEKDADRRAVQLAALRDAEADASAQPDNTAFVEKLLAGPGLTNPVVRTVLGTITQETLIAPLVHLRSHLDIPLTKDVRTEDGWRIDILLMEDTIQVVHTRQEQSLDADASKGFRFEWALMCTLARDGPREGVVLSAATLRIVDLVFGDSIDPVLREDLKQRLCHGQALIQ